MERAIDRYARLLWSVAGAILTDVGGDEEIEECVADVFVYLWQNAERFDPARGKLRSWLCLIARSRATDRYRKLSRESTVSYDDIWMADALWDGEALDHDRKAEVIDAVCALEEPEREIVVRRFYYEQRPRRIALAMDMTVKQVENRLYRAKKKLRRILEGDAT